MASIGFLCFVTLFRGRFLKPFCTRNSLNDDFIQHFGSPSPSVGSCFCWGPSSGTSQREDGRRENSLWNSSHKNPIPIWLFLERPHKNPNQHTKFQSPTTLGWSWIPEMSVRGQISLWPKSGIPGWFIRRSLASAITKLLTEADPTAVAMGRIKATELPSSKWKRVTHNKP